MQEHKFDVLIYGATPCGISAALAAAGKSKRVALIATHPFIGGLMASGLSCTDLRFHHAHGGIFKNFIERVLRYYVGRYGVDSDQVRDSNHGIWFEPHVAEMIFGEMLNESREISLLRDQRLLKVNTSGGNTASVLIEDRNTASQKLIMASVFIDATYEGDLAALSGVAYRFGREDRSEYLEPYAGRIFLKNPGLEVLSGSTGEGDDLTQAYNFRLILTNDAANRLPFPRPAQYDRSRFVSIADAANNGKVKDIEDVIRLSPIPNSKFNGNNRPTIVSLDLPMENQCYPDGDEETREKIIEVYRSYTLGLLYFLQNDEDLPVLFRERTAQWGFCKDEFKEHGGLSRELYVREARRIVGRKTFTSHDVFLAPGSERTPVHADSIAVADYQVDSHIVQRKQKDWPQYEGHVYLRPISKPAQVPFGIMVPELVGSLLVPGAVSATHLGFSVLRMEPVWMAMGQAAGTAASMAVEQHINVSEIDIDALQHQLITDGQITGFFHDVGVEDKLWEILNVPFEKAQLDHVSGKPAANPAKGILYFATKGFFNSYYARPADPVTRYEAVEWLDKFIDFAGFNIPTRDAVNSFPDVTDGHILSKQIGRLYSAGVLAPWRDTNGFFGGAALSRYDALQWIKSSYAGDKRFMNDSGGADLYEKYEMKGWLPVEWSDGDFRDGHYCTRQEFLDILYNTYMYYRNIFVNQKISLNEA